MIVKVIPVKGQSSIYPGQEVDIEFEEDTVATGLLTPAAITNDPKQVCYIKADTYKVHIGDTKLNKQYPLGSARIKCEYKQGIVTPIIRKAKGRETLAFKTYDKGVWENNLVGIDCPYWPVIE